MKGKRVVIDVIEPKNPPVPKPLPERAPAPLTGETRRVVLWPAGMPWAWHIENVPVRKSEPRWAARARELRAFGWSIRRIMKELGVRNRRQMDEILNTV